MINKILKNLGFSALEIKTYIWLLEMGAVTAGQLAKKLGMPRSSLYGFLKRLQEKGVVVQSLRMGVKTFSAEKPEKINLLFQQKIESLEKNQQLFQGILPQLRQKQGGVLVDPKFQLFEGEEGVKNILKDMLLYSNLKTRAFWPIKSMIDILGSDFFRYLNKRRIKSNLSTRAIWPRSQVVDVKKHPYLGVDSEFKREIRIAPPKVNFTLGYWLYGYRAAFISSRKESFGFIIESREFVEMLTTQFEVLWNMSKPIKVDEKYTDPFLQEMAKPEYKI